MRIILNSDILISMSFRHEALSEQLRRLCEMCRDRDATLVVPDAALLEFNQHRAQHRTEAISELQKAYDLLDQYAIHHDDVPPNDVVSTPDLLSMLRTTGATVEHVQPSLEDFREAHHRACWRLAPRVSDRSDEMRDLIIWIQALRLAEQGSGAVLVAQDRIFHLEGTAEEAANARLKRVKTIEEAIEAAFGVKSPSEQLAELLVRAVWEDLVAAGLPLTLIPVAFAVSGEVFTMGSDGALANANMNFSGETSDHSPLQAVLRIRLADQRIRWVSLADIRMDGDTWGSGFLRLPVDRPMPKFEFGVIADA
jgi:hypothetical protein